MGEVVVLKWLMRLVVLFQRLIAEAVGDRVFIQTRRGTSDVLTLRSPLVMPSVANVFPPVL